MSNLASFEHASFHYYKTISHVLLKFRASEKSPARSPTKMYSSLEVISPIQLPATNPTINSDPVTDITIDSSTVESDSDFIDSFDPLEELAFELPATHENLVTAILSGMTMMNVGNSPDMAAGENHENTTPSLMLQVPSPRVSQKLLPSQEAGTSQVLPGTTHYMICRAP